MASESSLPSVSSLGRQPSQLRTGTLTYEVEVGVVFTLIMLAVWSLQGRFNSAVSMGAALLVIVLTSFSGFSKHELGLDQPLSGLLLTLTLGAVCVSAIVVVGAFTRGFGLPHAVPWNRAWQYALWALIQEFILQSFFFVRLEHIFGGRRAVWVAATLFAIAHIPSPVLTVLSFLGALFFCEMFRRYRNIFPLGLIHAALGLTIAASLPDSLLHHMRVGIGFLIYHA